MQPNQKVDNYTQSKDNAIPNKPKKKSRATLIGMILLAILATSGIGFGVWAMLDGNSRVAKKDEQISELNDQIAKQSTPDEATIIDIDEGEFQNPIIKSTDPAEIYQVYFTSSLVNGNNDANIIEMEIKDGTVERCEFAKRTNTDAGGHTTTPIADCNIVGLDGDIFKVVQFGAGQDSSSTRIGFIMTDGAVKYTLPFHEAIENKDLSIKGNLAIDGKVRDAVDVNVADAERGYGGYGATIFILDDSAYVKFNEAMIK